MHAPRRLSSIALFAAAGCASAPVAMPGNGARIVDSGLRRVSVIVERLE